MKTLLGLVQSLTHIEIQFIRNYYKTKSHENSKRLILFNLIAEGKVKCNNDAINKIYPEKSNVASALSHLKRKLSEDILNTLLVLSPETEINRENHQEFQFEKKLLQCEILMARGMREEGLSILDKTSKLAEKYDFPGINLASYNILMKYNVKKRKDSSDNQFERIFNKYHDLLKAKKAYVYGNKKCSFTWPDQDISCNCSKRTKYWYKLSEIDKLCKQGEFSEGKRKTLKLLNFLHSEHSIHSKEKEAQVNKVLTEILLNLGEYEKAMNFAKITHSHLSPYLPEYQDSLIVVFFAFLRNGHFLEAEDIYEQAIRQPRLNEIYNNKWILLRGTLDFYQKNYKNVHGTLLKWDPKYCESPRWSLSPRFLELLTILEVGDYEWYEYRFDCLRKKITNIKLNVIDRINIVYCLLKSLIKTDFNYDIMIEKEKDNFEMLKKASPKFYWNPVGYELVNIPHWILNKSTQFNSTIH